MPTFLQKLKLAFRGWERRREESQEAFLARNTGWGAAAGKTVATASTTRGSAIDLEGLQVAFLDESGQIVYYLDTESGDVVDVRDGSVMPNPRYRRVPRRNDASEAEDRRCFVATLDGSSTRDALAACAEGAQFRGVLAGDRALERAWYNFKNDRATAAVEVWLRSVIGDR
jgi:hypothetical protein